MSSWNGEENRRHQRVKLRLPCVLQTSEFELRATVIDLSYGGAGVQFPSYVPEFRRETLRQIDIEGLGIFDVIYRWNSGGKLGVAFKNEARAREKVKAYFDAQGIQV